MVLNLSKKENDDKIYHLLISPGVPISILSRITKELKIKIVEEEVCTNPPGEVVPTKIKTMAFESTSEETLVKARQLIIEYLNKRIEEFGY